MFDIGWQELFIIAAIAIVVVGPKDLPRVLRTITQIIRKARGMASEFQRGIDDVVREAELDDLRKQVEASADIKNIGKEIENAIDEDGDWGDQFREIERDLNESARGLTDDSKPAPQPKASEPAGPPPPPSEPIPAATAATEDKKTEQTG